MDPTPAKTILTALIASLFGIQTQLESPEIVELLATTLHSNERDVLPDRELETLVSQAVDKLDHIQELLLPSVTKLADGFFGFLYSKALSVLTDLEIADEIGKSGPLTVEVLAHRAGVQPERLEQLLTLAIGNGVFSITDKANTTTSAEPGQQPQQRLYTNNRASELLRKDHWTQWHHWADLYPNEFYEQCRSLPLTIKTGETRTAFQIEYNTNKSMYEYFATKPGKVAKFHNTLGAGAVAMARGLTEDYVGWGEIAERGETVLDIGGGSGSFIAGLLRKYEGMRGGILDIESVIEHTKPAFESPEGAFVDVNDRMVDFIVGNFLEEIPPYSTYTMKWCLHNWGDEDVVKILKNVRRGIITENRPWARFVIIESVMEEGRMGRLERYANLLMMVSCNGKERGRAKWEELCEKSGWRLVGVHRLRRAWPCALDLRPV